MTDLNKQANSIIKALGGVDNISDFDACATRLRITVKTMTKVKKDSSFTKLDAYQVVRIGDNDIQLVYGEHAMQLRNAFVEITNKQYADTKASPDMDEYKQAGDLINAVGGLENIEKIDACLTRLRLKIIEMSKLVSDEEFNNLGANKIVRLRDNSLHLVYGVRSSQLKKELSAIAYHSGYLIKPNGAIKKR